MESEGAQAICQAHQSKPHYCRIATPACYYAILSAKPQGICVYNVIFLKSKIDNFKNNVEFP